MFGFLPSIGPWELGAILLVVLFVFGPGKLPEVGKAIGSGIRNIREASSTSKDQTEADLD